SVSHAWIPKSCLSEEGSGTLPTKESSPTQPSDWMPTQFGGLFSLESSPTQPSDWTPLWSA
ncbi:hypothetical protein A2U01_0047616, partial [Trifolium medium]|nr:hypothetical protein [Trifolium medium]